MWKRTQKASLLSLGSNLLYVVCTSLRKCLKTEKQKGLKIFGVECYFCWTENQVMGSDLGKTIAVCWLVLPSFILRMLNSQISMVKLCSLRPLIPAALAWTCSPLLKPLFNSSGENWLWVHRSVCSSSWSMLLFSCSPPSPCSGFSCLCCIIG